MHSNLVFIGMPAVGKTTLARQLASLFGMAFCDLDEVIEHERGMSMQALVSEQGEEGFRELETHCLEALAIENTILATGGGAVLRQQNRQRLAQLGVVIYLKTEYALIQERLRHDTSRPLLTKQTIASLFESRQPIYEKLANHSVYVNQTLEYPVYVGKGFVASLGSLCNQSKIVFVSDALVWNVYGFPNQTVFLLASGEAHKTLSAAQALWEFLGEKGCDRSTCLVALGGGIVNDVTGFVAACYHRGVDWIAVPTTLLGQVDAAIGGKTGLNLNYSKNVIGAFYPPQCVMIDIAFLTSLPEREYAAGLAEVIKYGLLENAFLNWLEANSADILARDRVALEEMVRQCVLIKINLVKQDEKELSVRAHLNVGHTFGHAIETVSKHAYWHGEAVALGLLMALELSRRLLGFAQKDCDRVKALLQRAGLPTRMEGVPLEALLFRMQQDKKKRGQALTFVLLKGVGRLTLVTNPPMEAVKESILTYSSGDIVDGYHNESSALHTSLESADSR